MVCRGGWSGVVMGCGMRLCRAGVRVVCRIGVGVVCRGGV